MGISSSDAEVLKRLGSEYMAAASAGVHAEKVELWKALNRGAMERPMVCIDQLPWNELNQGGELTCKAVDPFWRKVELELRQTLYTWNHFPVDMVLEPYITIPKVITNSGYGLEIHSERLALTKDTTAASQCYERILKTFEDLEHIQDMEITYDKDAGDAYFDEARTLFADIAPIQQSHGIEFHLGLWDYLTQIIGMEDIYYELMDRPEFMHACMERLTQAALHGIEQANELACHNDISPLCHCSYVFTDELLPAFGQGKGPYSQYSWSMGLAQLFTSVSPETFYEFEVPYISRLAGQFGMIYYGCCDRLDDRLEYVKQIPNVRKVSCSPWSDRKAFAENIGESLVMSNKPSPAFLARPFVDWAEVRSDLEYTLAVARDNGVNLEFILKDISTVAGEPERLTAWADIAMEVVGA